MKLFGGRKKKRASLLVISGAAAISLVAAGAANAIVSTTSDAVAFAGAMSAFTPTGGSFAQAYPCVAEDPNTPADEGLCPTAVSDTPLAGFPTSGATYSILTTGNAAYADDANTAGNTGYGWGVSGNPPIGAGVYDYQVARIDLPPATTACLAFDFRFLSDEFPEYVNTNYNDAFIAQLDNFAVTADPTTQTVTAPGNFAGGAGDVISVDAGGPSAMIDTAANGLGTTYDGATPLLTARIPVAVGSSHSLFLTIFDQGDAIYDSAVFLDNLRFDAVGPAQCKSLSNDPYDGTTGTNPVSGQGPKLAKDLKTITIPLECNLPPGPVSCPITGAASFAASPGRTISDRDAALLGQTALATGAVTIAPNTVGNLVMQTTKAGIKALKAAQDKPAKLKKAAKKLKKKAKKLRGEGKAAKAQKLEKKAKKLVKRAAKLKKKPLGTIKLAVTNSINSVTQTFTYKLDR